MKNTNFFNYANDSTLYTYNKNLEAVICNLRQEFSILAEYGAESSKVSLSPDLQLYYIKTQEPRKTLRFNYW